MNGNGTPWYKSNTVVGVIVFFIGATANSAIWLASNSFGAGKILAKFEEIDKWKDITDVRIKHVEDNEVQDRYGVDTAKAVNLAQDAKFDKWENAFGKIDVIAEKVSRIEADAHDSRGRK